MGSMLKFDSERRELVRERRNARIERKLERRQARERKHSQTADVSPAPSATQVLAEAGAAVGGRPDRDRRARPPRADRAAGNSARREHAACRTRRSRSLHGRPRCGRLAAGSGRRAARAASATSPRSGSVAARRSRRRAARPAGGSRGPGSRRRSPTRSRRSQHPEAEPWGAEREQLEAAIATGRIAEVGAAARGAMWAISRDAARTSPRRARRDPELALAACVAYAVIARLPRTALRSAQRARPIAQTRSDRRRAFWR